MAVLFMMGCWRMQPTQRKGPRTSGARRTKPVTSALTRQKTGASQKRVGITSRLQAWRLHHYDSARNSLQRLLSTPLQTLLTLLVVAIALALPAFFFVALGNLETLGQNWQGRPQLSVYLHKEARSEAITAFERKVESRKDVADVSYISAAQALVEFERMSGLGAALQTLSENPLPPALILSPSDLSPEALDSLQHDLSKDPLVETVQLDMDWVLRLNQLLELAGRLVMSLGLLLGLGVLLVIGNTIRLAIENRRAEIIVVKLVGGTDGFVRRPFLYTGIWYGLGGGLLALILLLLTVIWLSGPVNTLSSLYESEYQLSGLGFLSSIGLLLIAGSLGLAGAWLAVRRHLSAIEPT